MIEILVAVQIVAGSAPETSVQLAEVFPLNGECKVMAHMLNEGPPAQNDPQGRTVMSREFTCLLVDGSRVAEMQKALGQ